MVPSLSSFAPVLPGRALSGRALSGRALPLRALSVLALAATLLATAPSLADPRDTMQPPLPPHLLPAATAPAGTARDTVLRPMPAHAQGLRLAGETDHREWPVYLTEHQVRAARAFDLALTSAVSVMPEGSRVTVRLNDHVVGMRPIEAFGRQQRLSFEVPPDVLRPGLNAVRISVRQRHRVACDVGATYELWSDIDPARTGLRLTDTGSGLSSLADLAALAPDTRGAVPLRAIVGDLRDTRALDRLLTGLSRIARDAGFSHSVVELRDAPTGGPGLELIAGTPEDLATLGAPATPEPGSLMLVENAAHGGATLIVSGRDGAELDRLIGRLGTDGLAIAPRTGTPAGLRARDSLARPALSAGDRLTLADLGHRSVEFNGRLHRTRFDLRLPADFYPAETGSVDLHLAGGYAPGLLPTSQVVVRVNGRVAAGLPLNDPDGEVFTDRTIRLSLAAFRPGRNRVEIAAQLDTARDSDCDTLAAIDAPPRFLLLDATEIRIPSFPRLLALPALDASFAGGLARLGGGALTLRVPHANADVLSAAATLAVRLNADADRALPVRLRFGRPSAEDGDTGAALVVGAFADLPPTTLASVGLAPDRLRTAWRAPAGPDTGRDLARGTDPVLRRVTTLQTLNDSDPITTASVPQAGAAGTRAVADPVTDPEGGADGTRDELLRRWEDSLRGDGPVTRIMTRIEDGVAGLWPGGDPAPTTLASGTSLVMAQAHAEGLRGGLRTVITAPTTAALAISMQDLVAPARWRAVGGGEARYDMLAGLVETTPAAATRFVVSDPTSLANWRLVAAGWFSHNPLAYVALILCTGALLAFATRHALAGNARERT